MGHCNSSFWFLDTNEGHWKAVDKAGLWCAFFTTLLFGLHLKIARKKGTFESAATFYSISYNHLWPQNVFWLGISTLLWKEAIRTYSNTSCVFTKIVKLILALDFKNWLGCKNAYANIWILHLGNNIYMYIANGIFCIFIFFFAFQDELEQRTNTEWFTVIINV